MVFYGNIFHLKTITFLVNIFLMILLLVWKCLFIASNIKVDVCYGSLKCHVNL